MTKEFNFKLKLDSAEFILYDLLVPPTLIYISKISCGVKKNTTNKESANCRVLKLLILADGWCVTVPLSVRRGIPPMKTYDRLALM